MVRFVYGMFGSVLPDIIVFYSKRFSVHLLYFNIFQYIAAITLYALAAGIVARIYPYKISKDDRWNAVIVGIALPFIVSAIISVADRGIINPSVGLAPRGSVSSPALVPGKADKQQGTILDLMALY